MLKKVEDLTSPESKGLNTVPNYFSLQKNQSPNMMDVRVNYDGSVERRLGSNTQNAVIIASSAGPGFQINSTGTLSANARSYWPLNETAGSRSDVIGTVTLLDSGGTLYSGGIKNQAALFIASTKQCLYADNPPSLTNNGNFSISGWVYLNSTSGTVQRTVASKSDFVPGTSQSGTDTLLLLHMDSLMSFSDNSAYNRRITAQGNAQISTAQSKFGGASGLFDGTGDYLQCQSNSAFNYARDFTVDCQIRPGSVTTPESYIWSQGGEGGGDSHFSIIQIRSSLICRLVSATISQFSITASNTIGTNSWFHVAAVRSNNLINFFQDGVVVGSATYAGSVPLSVLDPKVGAYITGTFNFEGNIDEFRVSNVAKWGADFTPSTAAYGNPPSKFEYWLYVDTDNKVVFDVSNSGFVANGSIRADSIGALTTSTWYNCVGWLDSSNGVLGVSVNLATNSASYTGGITTASAPFVLGAVSNGAGSFMDGRIDETGYWAKVLTRGERQDLYNSGAGNTYTSGFDNQPWACFDFGASATRYLTVAAGTGIYASSNLGVTFFNIATDRSATYQRFERSKNVLVCTSDAYDNPLYWAGSAGTFSVLLNPSAPLCKIAVNFQGFLILLNSNTRKRGFYYIDENTQLTGATFNNFDIPSSADDEITDSFVLRRYLYVSTRYKLFRVSYVGGNPDWQFIEVKNWGFIPRTAKKVVLTNNQPGVGFYYSIGEVAVGLTFDQKIRIFDGSGDQIISNPIEKDNKYCDFALEKIPYIGSGPVISFAETDPNQNVYKLCLAIGKDSTQTTHFLNYDGRALAFYPYSNMSFNCMCMAESDNRRFLMAFDRSSRCHMMDSGNLDGNTARISGVFDSPLLYEKSPSQSHKGYKTDLFFSNTTAGNIIYSDRLDGADVFIERRKFIISGSDKKLIRYESVDVPEAYNIYQFRLSNNPENTDPWRLLRWDHFVAGLGVGVNSYNQ